MIRRRIKPKRRNAPKAVHRRSFSMAAQQKEVARLTRERDEALEQQSAASEILRVIASSPTVIQSVLDAIATTAARLLDVPDAYIMRAEGQLLRAVARHGTSPLWAIGTTRAINRDWVTGRAVVDRKTVHVRDLQAAQSEFPEGAAYAKQYGHRTTLATPLLREGNPIGAFLIRRNYVKSFTNSQIELMQNFAAQAVIAIENTRLFEAERQRTRELSELLEQQTATSEVLQVIGSSMADATPVFERIVNSIERLFDCRQIAIFLTPGDGLVHMVAGRGIKMESLFAVYPLPIEQTAVPAVLGARQQVYYPDVLNGTNVPQSLRRAAQVIGNFSDVLTPMLWEGRGVGMIAVTREPNTPYNSKELSLLRTFAAQAVIAIENARLLKELRQRTDDLSQSLENLRTAQDRLVQTEKLASLGQLTAGIAHEIKNPLNFVNNFSAVSVELIDELQEALQAMRIDNKRRAEVHEIADMLRGNLDKVVQHGKRADAIVKNMLLHSRQGSGEHQPVDINTLVEESLNLAYHGARAEKQGFNITLERSFDPAAGEVDLFPQEITRVLLNLISNGFYAATKRKADPNGGDYEPALVAATKSLGDSVEIRIRDNGTGIPPEVKEKMFNPFFTTKPAGEGTGLGLSISHDIIVKQHGGSIEVDTQPGEFTEFRIVLPRAGASLIKSGERA